MFDIKYNGYRPSAYNCMLATIPVLTQSEIREDRFTIPYRDGDLLGKSYRGNAHITFTIHMKRDESSTTAGNVTYKERIKRWLSQKGQLFIYENGSNPIDRAYYEVLKTTFTEETYKKKDYWRLVVDMEVYPFKILLPNNSVSIGTTAVTVSNDGDVCKPTYQINSTAAGNLTVNGYNFVLKSRTVAGIVIDTRRMIAYNPSNNSNLSQYVDGDYEKLWLPNGNSSIQAPASGVVYLNKGLII